MRRLAQVALAVWALGCARSARPAPTAASGVGVDAGASSADGPPTLASAGSSDAGASPGVAPASALAEADAVWARRDSEPGALERAARLYEDAALRAQDPSAALLGAARARRALADDALRDANSAREPAEPLAAAAAHAQSCAAEAHRSWSTQFPAAGAQLDGTHPAAEVYAQVGPAGAEALYLEAVCSAVWARTQGFTQLVERRAELEAAFRRAAEAAPTLDGGGPDRELGSLLAALPAYAGGDLAQAREHLERAIEKAPAEARNHLQLARTVAVKSQDRDLFVSQLKKVTESDDPVASAEAGHLLARTDELFGPSEAAQPIPGGPHK